MSDFTVERHHMVAITLRVPAAIWNAWEYRRQHYGKAISIGHWEDTCNYYMEHFPQYSDKWRQRKGLAVHTLSDFGTPLYSWEEVKKAGVIIHQ